MSDKVWLTKEEYAALRSRIAELERENAELAQRTWDNDTVSKRIDEAQRAAYERAIEIIKSHHRINTFGNIARNNVVAEIVATIKQEMEKGTYNDLLPR